MMLRSLPLPRVKSHVIWNDKGGVGKTTLTFHMATEYARSHPSETVQVIDLSPQLNASRVLLGSQNFNALDVLMSQGKTISFYIHQANSGWFPYPENYLTHVSFFNDKMPKNIKLLAAERLIIPVNADDFSLEALKSVLYLVYGIVIDHYKMPVLFKLYGAPLYDKARMLNLRLPKIHLVINNRVTMYASSPAKAFGLMGDSILQVLRYSFKTYPAEDPMRDYFEEFPDLHTVGIVALHTGCPLANLFYRNVPFLGETIQLNRSQINCYLQSLQRLVEKL